MNLEAVNVQCILYICNQLTGSGSGSGSAAGCSSGSTYAGENTIIIHM